MASPAVKALFCLGLVAASSGACGGDPTEEAEVLPSAQPALRHSFDPIELAAGAELVEMCQSWVLGNDEPLYVDEVALEAGPGWHHSNWFALPEEMLQPPEGVWPCGDFMADTVSLGFDGQLLFGQSTQTSSERLVLPAGSAIVVPAHSVVVGNLHLLNATDSPITTSVTLELSTLAASDVRAKMNALGLFYQALEIAPRATSEFEGECPLAQTHVDLTGRAMDFQIHYVSAHYHSLGRRVYLEVIGGPHDGETIYESTSFAEPLGKTIDPPFDLSGASGLRFGCTFENPSSATIGWGTGAQEMCAVGAFVDSELNWLGGVLSDNQALGDTNGDGAVENRGECKVAGLRPPE